MSTAEGHINASGGMREASTPNAYFFKEVLAPCEPQHGNLTSREREGYILTRKEGGSRFHKCVGTLQLCSVSVHGYFIARERATFIRTEGGFF